MRMLQKLIVFLTSSVLLHLKGASCRAARPGPLTVVEIIPLGSTGFYIRWSPSAESSNAVITNYEVTYSSPVQGGRILAKAEARKVFAMGFSPNEQVKFGISAVSKNRNGPKTVLEMKTGGKSTTSPAKPGFVWTSRKNDSGSEVLVQWLPCGANWICGDDRPGSGFFVKYRIKGSPDYEVMNGSDGYAVIPVTPNKNLYEFIVVSVDGDYQTESDPVEINTARF